MSSKFKPNTTQTPNIVFDRLMYELPDTEFKVLCAIIRKTYGWHKDSDRIANSQFEAMTGAAKRQIQRAKASLKRKGLITETPPKKLGGVPEYEFLEHDPVSPMTPPRVTHDTPPVSPMTPTKDTNNKRQYTKKQVASDTAVQSDINSIIKVIQDSTGMVLYGDYRLRNIIKKALTSEGKEYLSDVLENYLKDEFMKAKRAWSFTSFFSSKEKMERHKTRTAEHAVKKSTLPEFGKGEVWYAESR